MRAPHYLAITLLATTAIAACKDAAPTSTPRASADAEARASTAMAMAHSPTASGFTVQLLSRSSFPDDVVATFRLRVGREQKLIRVNDPSDVVVAKVIVAPGGSLGWHTHPGPAIATVASGELSIINAADCVTRRYAGGKAFVDPGQGNVHIGFNASAREPAVVYVTFLDVPAGQGPTIPAADPGC